MTWSRRPSGSACSRAIHATRFASSCPWRRPARPAIRALNPETRTSGPRRRCARGVPTGRSGWIQTPAPTPTRRRTPRGFFAVLRLERFGEGVRPHERTLSAPKEDRLRLLRVTATNTSPIVLLSDDRTGRTADLLEGIASAIPTAEATDDAGIRHRIWALPADDPVAGVLTAGAEAAPLTIADGPHP